MQDLQRFKQFGIISLAFTTLVSCGQQNDKVQDETTVKNTKAVTKESATIDIALAGVKASTNGALSIKEQVLAAAKKNDFRLLATSGRSISIPGLSAEEAEYANKNCGVKLLPSMGDVIKSKKQREQRKETYQHMQAYNKEMIKLCKRLV